jgi:hypothetical protein
VSVVLDGKGLVFEKLEVLDISGVREIDKNTDFFAVSTTKASREQTSEAEGRKAAFVGVEYHGDWALSECLSELVFILLDSASLSKSGLPNDDGNYLIASDSLTLLKNLPHRQRNAIPSVLPQ